MFKSTFTHLIPQRVTQVGTALLIALVLCVLPLAPQGTIQTAEATYPTQEQPGPQLRSIQWISQTNSVSAQADASLELKEYTLDNLAWILVDSVLSNMVTSLTQWINSGFQGSPAFVTDLQGFLVDAADEAFGEFINSGELGFLCDPFQLEVKAALSIQYQQSKSLGAQCTLTDVTGNMENFLSGTFSEGGWAGWFELTQSPYNDPNRAIIESRAHVNDILLKTRDREFRLLEGNEFFKNIEVCEPVETEAGTGNQSKCQISTPGNIIQDQFSKQLGIGQDRLTIADELDEMIGALIAQFANQAIMGVNGLLGMGATSFADNSYGSGGNSSYIEAVSAETAGRTLSGNQNAISEAIALQQEYISLQRQIIGMIDDVEVELESTRNRFPSCFRLRMPSELTDERDFAEAEITRTQNIIQLLLALEVEYEAAQTPEEQEEVLVEFNELVSELSPATTIDITEAEFNIEFVLADLIDDFRSEINQEENRCERRTTTTSTGR